MKTIARLTVFIMLAFVACKNDKEVPQKKLTFEKINYYKYPMSLNKVPFQSRVAYYFSNGKPHRWMLLDSLGKMETDYIYEYDAYGTHIGARYREDGTPTFSVERVRYENDSTTITEWIDSTGTVYYRMIDNLNRDKKTYRATFIGDEVHGYDSTFYTSEGFEKRIFFTNVKGKVFNDRSFVYDSVNTNGDWTVRKKIMNDSVQEIHRREVYYDTNFVANNTKFYEGIVTTGSLSENVISFSEDESVLFLTRTANWDRQQAFISYAKQGLFTETVPLQHLESIYNGAIAPNGKQILYSTKNDSIEEIWLLTKTADEGWSQPFNLTEESGITGGYFNWFNENEIYFYRNRNGGDIYRGTLNDAKLALKDSLTALNTKLGTEFSPYVDKGKRYIIFTRYTEGDVTNQGFFVSYNEGSYELPKWSRPEKLDALPYGWSAFIKTKTQQFIYTDGEDIFSMPVSKIGLRDSLTLGLKNE